MKVVTPYRPFTPESGAHLKLGPFDWPAAVRMLRSSVRAKCRCETHLLTGLDCRPIGATHAYRTDETRLMLWLLDVCLSYLRSDDFDDDTIMLSPDTLVTTNLSGWFVADLGLIVRDGVQVWRRSAKEALVRFYARALELARLEPPSSIRWGADTAPLVALLDPLRCGPSHRCGLSVHGFPAALMFRPWRPELPNRAMAPVVDFKGVRKHHMADCYARLRIA